MASTRQPCAVGQGVIALVSPLAFVWCAFTLASVHLNSGDRQAYFKRLTSFPSENFHRLPQIIAPIHSNRSLPSRKLSPRKLSTVARYRRDIRPIPLSSLSECTDGHSRFCGVLLRGSCAARITTLPEVCPSPFGFVDFTGPKNSVKRLNIVLTPPCSGDSRRAHPACDQRQALLRPTATACARRCVATCLNSARILAAHKSLPISELYIMLIVALSTSPPPCMRWRGCRHGPAHGTARTLRPPPPEPDRNPVPREPSGPIGYPDAPSATCKRPSFAWYGSRLLARHEENFLAGIWSVRTILTNEGASA